MFVSFSTRCHSRPSGPAFHRDLHPEAHREGGGQRRERSVHAGPFARTSNNTHLKPQIKRLQKCVLFSSIWSACSPKSVHICNICGPDSGEFLPDLRCGCTARKPNSECLSQSRVCASPRRSVPDHRRHQQPGDGQRVGQQQRRAQYLDDHHTGRHALHVRR